MPYVRWAGLYGVYSMGSSLVALGGGGYQHEDSLDMPITKTTDPIKGDRIVDYLDEAIDVARDGSLMFQGHLGPDNLRITLYDRPKEARGSTGRRYLVRITDVTGEDDRTRVFSHEPSAVAFLDGIERGLDMKHKPRGVAARNPVSQDPLPSGPVIRRLPAKGSTSVEAPEARDTKVAPKRRKARETT